MRLYSILLIVWSILGSTLAQSPPAEDQKILSDQEHEALRLKVKRFMDEFTDVNLLDKSIQVRKQGKSRDIRTQIKKTPDLPIAITLYTTLNVDEFWARCLTGKWIYTPNGKVKLDKKQNLAEQLNSYAPDYSAVDLRFTFDTVSNRKQFQVTPLVHFNQKLQDYLGTKKDTLITKIEDLVTSTINNKVYENPRDVPIDSLVEVISLYLKDRVNYWEDFVKRTASVKNKQYEEDLKLGASTLDYLIKINQELTANKETDITKYAYGNVGEPTINQAISEFNSFNNQKIYILSLISEYAIGVDYLQEVANDILKQSKLAKAENVILITFNSITDEEKGLIWEHIDYYAINTSTPLVESIGDFLTKGVETSTDPQKGFAQQSKELFCGLSELLHAKNNNINTPYLETACQDFQEALYALYISYDQTQEKVTFTTVESGLAYATLSGYLFKPNQEISQVTFNTVNGNVVGFVSGNKQYEEIKFMTVNDPEKETKGFAYYIEQGKFSLLNDLANKEIREYLALNKLHWTTVEKEKKIAEREWLLARTTFKPYLYTDYTPSKAGDWVVTTQLTVTKPSYTSEAIVQTKKEDISKPLPFEISCSKQLVKWKSSSSSFFNATNPNFPMYGSTREVTIPNNVTVEKIEDYGEVNPVLCSLRTVKNIKKYGAKFIDAHYNDNLSLPEKEAVLSIALLYDKIGAAIARSYLQEQNLSLYEKYIQWIPANKTQSLTNSADGRRYRDFYIELYKRVIPI